MNSKKIISLIGTVVLLLACLIGSTDLVQAKEKGSNDFCSRYVAVGDKRVHIAMYGAIDENSKDFLDTSKTTVVMLPGLGVPSPHLYFKPLAQALESDFNIVIVEPLGYGLSELTETDRTVHNMNVELNHVLDTLKIEECVLLVHSISGVYGLNFIYDYPEKVKGFIAVDNTVYAEELAESMEWEKEYALQGIKEFQDLRASFPSIEAFQNALRMDPEKYGATLPEIVGYTYPDSDKEEYIQAYSMSNNDTIKSEVNHMEESLLSIKDKKFPSGLPVLTMICSENVESMPVWETAHREQLDFEAGNHQLYTVKGGHYIWYTNLDEVVRHIQDWRVENHF